MKAPPPLTPAQKGNFQIAPRPMAEPALAKMNPKRELHSEEVVAIKNSLSLFVVDSGEG